MAHNYYGFGKIFEMFTEIIIPILLPYIISLPFRVISPDFQFGIFLVLTLIGIGITIRVERCVSIGIPLWSYIFYIISYQIKEKIRRLAIPPITKVMGILATRL